MNRSLICIATLALTATAVADEIDQRQDADPNGLVSVYNTSGSIEISGWDRAEIEVSGSIGDDVNEFIFERSGPVTTIKVNVPNNTFGRVDVSSNLVIRVPAESSLDVGTVSADIEVEGVRGEQELQAVSGDIQTEVFGSDLKANTVSGDIDVDAEGEGEARLVSVSGDITAQGLNGEINAEAVSGDIDIRSGSFDEIKAETVNGDISWVGELRKKGRLDMETVNGGIDIEFVGVVDARFDIETFNGRIKNCFGPKPERTSKYAPGWELSFTEGDGLGRVTLATLNGSLDLCKG